MIEKGFDDASNSNTRQVLSEDGRFADDRAWNPCRSKHPERGGDHPAWYVVGNDIPELGGVCSGEYRQRNVKEREVSRLFLPGSLSICSAGIQLVAHDASGILMYIIQPRKSGTAQDMT